MYKLIHIILLALFPFLLQAQEKKHSVFINSNYNISIENSLYIDFDDPDFEVWSEPQNNFSFGAGYTYNFTEYFGAGMHFEFEKIEFEHFYLGEATASRFVLGGHVQTRYPKTTLHGLTGGYFNVGGINSDDFDNRMSGIEYGVFIGPAYSVSDVEIALLFYPKFSYFFSDKEAPNSGLILYPRVSLKISYNL